MTRRLAIPAFFRDLSVLNSAPSGARLFACAAAALLAASAVAQMHKVEPPEKVTRAIGVYEWTGDLAKPTAARLVPITLFINGHFEDAGVYLSRPVPMALLTGTVYEIDQAGKPIGTVNLEVARHITTRHSAEDDNPLTAWYGYGAFHVPSVAPPVNLHPSAQLPVIAGTDDDDRPHMSRRPETATAPSGTVTGTNPPPTPTADADDPDRPTLRHRDAAPAGKPSKDGDTGAVIPMPTSLNADPDRPVMRRGKPLGEASTPQLTGVPPNLHQAAAVSDAANHDEHIFARDWDSANERIDTLAALQALANPLIQKYVATNALQGAGPLANEQLLGYTLSYGGLPTFVYTAETPLANGGPVYLTLVAQRLPAGNLQTALVSVTDAQHLDRVPWLRPIDAVDPDWSHRASLLFELRAQNSRQFALYRLITAKAEQTFLTGIID